ncbi:hypothetical protein MKZ38_007223 [Zalerion maritima]|uniref:Uncharacterized protein n=1 Tax=Zalerion maritima TaxID=339359 RepID=A0AAD5WN20_9PEZI|nr:hypothetical protein MKZ38_007223 [Zalerion maritima]
MDDTSNNPWALASQKPAENRSELSAPGLAEDPACQSLCAGHVLSDEDADCGQIKNPESLERYISDPVGRMEGLMMDLEQLAGGIGREDQARRFLDTWESRWLELVEEQRRGGFGVDETAISNSNSDDGDGDAESELYRERASKAVVG